MTSRIKTLAALVGCIAPAALATPAVADSGGVPHNFAVSCGVGAGEAQSFVADPTQPGASEINQFPPVAFGCTGPPSSR